MRAALLAGLLAAVAWPGQSPTVAASAHRQGAADAPALTISAEPGPDGLELRLDGFVPMPAAVFQRGALLWVLVAGGDGPIEGWPGLGRPDVAHWLTPVGSEPVGRGHLLRFALRQSATVNVEAAPIGWRIQVGPADETPHPPEAGDRFARSIGHGTLEANVDGELVEVMDPATGERLGALLSATAGLRQAAPVRLVDLELLPSAQGLVWRPLADGVTARLDGGRLSLGRVGGLRLSQATAVIDGLSGAAYVDSRPGDSAGMSAASLPSAELVPGRVLPSPPIGLAALGPTDPATRQRARLDLLAGMRRLDGLPRAVARLELAKLYLADALGPEARTALELIDTASLAGPAARAVSLSKAAMAGAAAAVTGQHDRALATLLDHRLDEDPEVALWRAYAAARAARWELAAQEWARSDESLEGYPAPLRRLLGLEMASAMAEQGDAGAALTLIDRLRPLALSADTRARLHLIEGLGLARTGQSSQADRALQSAAAHGDGDIRARAAFLLTSLRQERGALSAGNAAAALAAQQPGWRGHPWEVRMLRRLAELQAAAGQSMAALGSWEAAQARAPDARTSAAIGDDQRARLRLLLRATGDDALPPIAALALYRTYGQLLGAGEADTEIRLGLAARAADSGLLETAAALLERPRTGAPPATTDGEAKLALGDDMAAMRDSAAARSSWAALLQQREWANLARSAAAALPPDVGIGQLDGLAAEAATWLALAQHELGQPGAAAELARRLADRIGTETPAVLLQLAAQPGPTAVSPVDLPAAIGAYAEWVREALDQLPALATEGDTEPLKSAAERSNPAG